jgi:thiol-disulfide isomerase/thioredoxin
MKPLIVLALISIMMLGCLTNSAQQHNGAVVTVANESASSTQSPATQQVANTSVHTNFSANITREIRGDIMTTDTVFPVPLHYDFTNKTTPDGRTIVYFFYSTHCSACQAILPEIDKLKTRFSSVEWVEYDITTKNGTTAYHDFAEQMNLTPKQEYVPQVFVNGTIITDRFNINSTLGSLLENLSAS